MKIAQSDVFMASSRTYARQGVLGRGISGSFSDSEPFDSLALKELSTPEGAAEGGEVPGSLQNNILASIFRRFMASGVYGSTMGAMGGGGVSMMLSTYSEYESVDFNARGMAVTEDGRTIDFGIELSMSRSYMEYTNLQIRPVQSALMDPLVINVSSGVTRISDQKFFFDLDCDGKEEEISTLGGGSGFLALDIDGDGVISDGRELFGALTGDGFSDLAAYDCDGNGWIDENDEIFNRLKVWYKNEDGSDVLMDLKSADVGAIYLGHENTEFSMYGGGGLNGVLRSTGFFLKESGGVGTVQHVDLATETVSDGRNYGPQNTETNGFTSPLSMDDALVIEVPDTRDVYRSTSAERRAQAREEFRARREQIREKRREDAARLLKKRMERKEMLDKQLERHREERRERIEAYEKHLAQADEGI